MNAQIIILITILLTVFVILLAYATWRIQHRQPYLTVWDNPMMSPYSEEQKQYMRQLRARNRDALREVAGTDAAAVPGLARSVQSHHAGEERAGPSRLGKGKGKVGGRSSLGMNVGAGNGYKHALARWNGQDEGRDEAGTWV